MEREILLLGDQRLYEVSERVLPEDMPALESVVCDLHDTLLAFRRKYSCGRAIAAPQIGVQKRVLYMNTGKPVVFVNPELSFPDDELMEVMDDCMSFPKLLVRVLRHRRCVIHYTDMQGEKCEMHLEGDLSELLQHEYDHLDGILAVMRAMDKQSFFMKR